MNDIDIYYGKVIVMTLFLSLTISKTALVVLVLFAGLILVGRRLIRLLSTRYIIRRSVSRLILYKILILFFYRYVSLKIFGINFINT